MIALFLSSIIALFLFTCFGFFMTKLLSIESTPIEKILVGFITVNALTCFLSIFIAISFIVTCSFILIATAFLFYVKNELAATFKIISTTYTIILFSIPFLIIGFNIALQEPSVFDSGLYHIQCIKWIEEYPTVNGLANLHHRFGFNPIAFSLYALTSLHYFFHQEIFSINLVLFSILTIYLINKLYNTFKNEGINTYFLFYAIFFYVLILLSSKISSPSPDYVSSAFLLFIFLRIIEIEHLKKSVTFKTFIPIVLLSAYCIMAKLSTIPIGLIILYIVYTYSTNWQEVLRISIGVILMCLPWFINTILLTGWLVYPFSAVDLFSFDWKVPSNIVNQANAEIIGWARSPNNYYYEASQLPLMKWVPIWWGHLTVYIKLLIVGSIILPIFLFIGQWIKIVPAKALLNLSVLASVLGTIFWFFTAPDFRFGHIFILIAFCSPLLYFNSDWSLFKNHSIIQKNWFFAIVCTALLFKLIRNNYPEPSKLFYTLKTNSIVPDKIHSTDATFSYVYVSNEKIYKPLMDERCFDHKIPCSFLDLSSIELRGTTLSAGFKSVAKAK